MAMIHLMCGFIGFGKTTIAKKLVQQTNAVRLTHDEIMVEKYGRNPDDFQTKYQIVDDEIRHRAAQLIKMGKDVILDYGFWTHDKRETYYKWAKTLTDNVVFHNVCCDMKIAKQRLCLRSKNNMNELYITEDVFDTLAKQYEPWDNKIDNYPVVWHNAPSARYIGSLVYVKIDRAMNSKHPKYNFEYPVNYGYIPNTKSGDGEELDAYVLEVDRALDEFWGRCIGVIHRRSDDDDKLIVVPDGVNLDDAEIERKTEFQEKWFKHILIRNPNVTRAHFGIYGCAIKDGKILVIKNARGPYTGLYDLPGGSSEENETYMETLIRELKEETNCNVIKACNERYKSIIFSDFTLMSGEKGVLQHDAVLFDVTISGDPKLTSDELNANRVFWVDIKDLNEKNATPYVLMGAQLPLIAIANEHDEIISTHLRGRPLMPNHYPMIAAVLLFNQKGNLIMQKIAACKKWGGLWTYSAAGHVDGGEDYAIVAKRELQEEMGIETVIEKEVAKFMLTREGRNLAFHHVFIAHSDAEILPDKSEVEEIREISLADLRNEIKQHPEQFFDGFLTAMSLCSDKL